MKPETFSPPEILNKIEVFTDDVSIVGPNDNAEGVFAYTTSCGVLSLDNRTSGTVGLIHLSEGGEAKMVILEADRQAKLHGSNLNSFTMRRFKGSETIWKDAEKVLKAFGVELPEWETTIESGIAISKKDGSIEFFI